MHIVWFVKINLERCTDNGVDNEEEEGGGGGGVGVNTVDMTTYSQQSMFLSSRRKLSDVMT